jgi:hypothetical protein
MSYYSLDPPLSSKLNKDDSPILVTVKSSKTFRNYVEFCARCFIREFPFGGLGFSADEKPKYRNHIPYEAFLFHRPAYDVLTKPDSKLKQRIIGACCFRYVQYTSYPAQWVMQWVWFHPYCRRRGYLSKAWPMFQERYKAFSVQKPLSASMQSFLNNQQH